ncbi:MAG: OprO/OprP family phosphate-selective porin [Gammaproteobacteria bacterium]|nr:OprO/OprP family phosphate-selective porin [Gammaproteobacteria bacterium]
MFNKKLKKNIIAAGIANCLLISPVYAANWLLLQGTEPEDAAPRIKMWGFIQAQYQKDSSDPNGAGGYIPPKLIGPNLSSQQQFNINRARLGARGAGFPLDGKVNYFLLTEFGNNGITAPGDRNVRVTDASITLNHIDGARIRAGLFKTPGVEEGLQAIHVFDYINFTTVTNQLMLERFPNRSYTGNNPPVTLPGPAQLGGFEKSVGAFRDVGIQVFDTFKVNDWEHSYAVMYGNGNGLNFGDNDNNKDTYLYWSSEQVYGGKGGRREGLKLFAWTQSGKRQLDNTNDSIHNPQEFDRDRSGAGVKYLKRPWRVSAEYMTGEGMIFVGPDKPTFDINGGGAGADGSNGEASGWYLEGGYYIPGTKWEVDLRYDVYNRLEGDNFEFEFETVTYGAQYHINKKTRVNMEYADRSAEAVNFATGAGPNANLDGVDSRFAIQLTHIF